MLLIFFLNQLNELMSTHLNVFFCVTAVSTEDDEYRWACVEYPKVMVTTSRDPSSKLKQFAKVTQSVKREKK